MNETRQHSTPVANHNYNKQNYNYAYGNLPTCYVSNTRQHGSKYSGDAFFNGNAYSQPNYGYHKYNHQK